MFGVLVALYGCQGTQGDSASAPFGDSGGEPLDCSGDLAIAPKSAQVLPNSLLQLSATGGSGRLLWSLTGGEAWSLNEDTGALLVGGEPAEGTVTVEDGCDGRASATVVVVAPLVVEPAAVLLAPGTTFTPSVEGGSGTASCQLPTDGSGAALSGCGYTAGEAAGLDVLRVLDDVTGEFVDVPIEVAVGAEPGVLGQDLLALPAGHSMGLVPTGGSGVFDLSVAGPIELDGERLRGVSGGTGVVTLVDRYLGVEVVFDVHVLEPVYPELERDGERSGEGRVVRAGDVNEDGYDDLLVAMTEASVEAWYGGAVMLHLGSSSGIDATPAQIFAGTVVSQTLGRDVRAADIDGDGHLDLLIGADRTDHASTNSGAVFIHFGDGTGAFGDEPDRTLRGEVEYDRFGTAIAACDFDGDGWMDLAVGAEDAADLTEPVPADEQGGVFLFRGAEDGFSDRAEVVVYGVDEDGEGDDDGHFGAELVAGDIDGDGLCDLVVGAPDAAGGDGRVLVYAGHEVDTVEREPTAIWSEDGGEFGRRMAIGDVDSDGDADVLVGAWEDDEEASNAGAAFLFLGRSISSRSADQTLRGDATSDYFGSSVAMGDLDDDGDDDLLIGALKADDPLDSEGVVYGFRAGSTVSAWSFMGEEAGIRLGQAVAVLDGRAAMLAGYDDTFGVHVGAVHVQEPGSSSRRTLDFPGESSGHEVGAGLAWFDVDGDGGEDLVVGAPNAGVDSEGGNTGTVRAFTDGGEQTLFTGHASYSASDRFGEDFAVTDFDGDGFDDLVVVGRRDSQPAEFDSDDWYNPTECDGYRSAAGSVHIYRGTGDGVEEDASWAWWVSESSGEIDVAAGGFDLDGDGREDLIVGSDLWGVGGGVAVLMGRKQRYLPEVVCDPLEVYADHQFDRLGLSLSGMEDLDGDGCDEVAFGATGEEFLLDYAQQGVVRVLWGFGSACDSSTAEVSTLAYDGVETGAGSSLAFGDVDGDGLGDLVVGASTHRTFFAEEGAVFVSPGWYLQSLPRFELEDTLPVIADSEREPLLPDDGLEARWGVQHDVAGSGFGHAVALLEDPVGTGRKLVAVGLPGGDEGGTSLAGGVRIYRFGDDGLELYGLVAGESEGPGGKLGQTLVGAGDTLLIGATESDQGGLDYGAAYVLSIP